MKKEAAEVVETARAFGKEAIMKSKRFADRRDALSFLLQDGAEYTIEQVQTILKEYYERKV